MPNCQKNEILGHPPAITSIKQELYFWLTAQRLSVSLKEHHVVLSEPRGVVVADRASVAEGLKDWGGLKKTIHQKYR
jgi:hypothetical protein